MSTTIPPDGTLDPTRDRLRQALASGADDTNPDFTFSCTNTALLLAIDAGLIDAAQLACRELANRGLDADGTWVGFDRAREIHSNDRTDADAVAAEIAQRTMGIATIETRNSDELDFHNIAVWQIKEALTAAFAAGQAAAK